MTTVNNTPPVTPPRIQRVTQAPMAPQIHGRRGDNNPVPSLTLPSILGLFTPPGSPVGVHNINDVSEGTTLGGPAHTFWNIPPEGSLMRDHNNLMDAPNNNNAAGDASIWDDDEQLDAILS